jgi:PAS domain S-box-containing protein
VDARFIQLSGLDPAQATEGLPVSAFFENVHSDHVARLKIGVAGALHGAEVFSREYRIVGRANVVARWVSARGGIERNEVGRVVRFTGVLADISDRKKAEERLAIAQSAGQVGTFEYSFGFGTMNVSEQFCRLLGLRSAEALPLRTVNSVVAHDDRPLFGSEVTEDYSEHRIRRANDQDLRWIARRGERRRDHPSDDRFVGVIYDITDAKRTEARLLELTERLEENVRDRTRERDRVWNNSRDLLAVLSLDGSIRSANPSWSAALGYKPQAVAGRTFLSFVSREDVKAAREWIAGPHAESGTSAFEVRMHSASGAVRWTSWNSVVEDDAIYVYGRDVTEEKESAASLRSTEEQLRQAHKMEAVGQLTGGLAHDFNNMLTGVIGGLDLIRKRISEGRLTELDRYMDAAVGSAQRAASLTHRLLAFSRRQTLDPKAVNANELVRSMQDMLQRTLGEQVQLQVVADDRLWLARTDANQLESAVLNLAINARDAMPSGGLLTIETANATLPAAYAEKEIDVRAGDYVLVSVSDNGSGMDEDTTSKAFDPFFTTKPIGQGTGLGLSMIYGFMRQIGGHAKIYSELGRGTTIKLFLPRFEGQADVAVAPTSAPQAPRGAGETVLVVEDDESVRLLIVDVLTELGYLALEAADGKAAIPILESNATIALLVTDVGLPGLNGRQLAEVARDSRPDLPVLFVTGYAANAAVRADFLGPGMDLISKPFQLDLLANKIRSMIEF